MGFPSTWRSGTASIADMFDRDEQVRLSDSESVQRNSRWGSIFDRTFPASHRLNVEAESPSGEQTVSLYSRLPLSQSPFDVLRLDVDH
jgi:hypothetical protein